MHHLFRQIIKIQACKIQKVIRNGYVYVYRSFFAFALIRDRSHGFFLTKKFSDKFKYFDIHQLIIMNFVFYNLIAAFNQDKKFGGSKKWIKNLISEF